MARVDAFCCTHPIEPILLAGYKGIILSGGPSSVYEEGAPLPPRALFDAGIPGHIPESPVTVVVVQNVRSEAGHI